MGTVMKIDPHGPQAAGELVALPGSSAVLTTEGSLIFQPAEKLLALYPFAEFDFASVESPGKENTELLF